MFAEVFSKEGAAGMRQPLVTGAARAGCRSWRCASCAGCRDLPEQTGQCRRLAERCCVLPSGQSGGWPALGRVCSSLLPAPTQQPAPSTASLCWKFAGCVFLQRGISAQAEEDTDASTLSVTELYCSLVMSPGSWVGDKMLSQLHYD